MNSIAESEVRVESGGVALPGTLTIPAACIGCVIFAHGSGSSRSSPRNRAVAHALVERGCATLLLDLLTPEEAQDRKNVFDIALLGERVVAATRWARRNLELMDLPIGYFGASTGAGAALVAAAELGGEITAVVSRGGRPDLASRALPRVVARTLLVVGSLDHEVLEFNRWAAERLTCEHEIDIVEGATHLFAEAGTLEQVVRLAGDWFDDKFKHIRSTFHATA